MPTEFLVSLVITTYNRADLLEKGLRSIAMSVVDDPGSVEVIVVDNNSTDDTVEKFAQARSEGFPFKLTYVQETNQGLSYARNRGIAEAKGKYVIFMDDDQIIEQHYLSRIPKAFVETKAACVGGPILYYNAEDIPDWLRKQIRNVGQIDLGDSVKILTDPKVTLRGGNIAIDRKLLNAVGGFDVQLGRQGNQLLGGEEEELQDRIRSTGENIAYYPDLIQYHYLRSEKFKKNYWRRHQFGLGRTTYFRSRDDWKNANRFFNAPRTLWWFLFTRDFRDFLGAFLSCNFTELFERELKIWFRLGQIYEARRTVRSRDVIKEM